MRDTIITGKRKRTEVITILICFLIANLTNLYAILTYDRSSLSELFTSMGYVVVFSGVLYVAWCVIRFVFYMGYKVVTAKKSRR